MFSDTGNMSPIIVENMVMANIIVTPEKVKVMANIIVTPEKNEQ